MSFQDLDLKESDFNIIHTIGFENTLFLTNDDTSELPQHFSENYENLFNEEKFRLSYEFKKNYCEDNNIKYNFFIVPDKSVVCKDYLPIIPKFTKRNYDLISDLVPDFTEILTPDDYFKGDSHINFDGGMKIAAEIMHNINDKVSNENYMGEIKKNASRKDVYYKGDLYDFCHPVKTDEELVNAYDFKLLEKVDNDEIRSKYLSKEFLRSKMNKFSCFYNKLSLTSMRCLTLSDFSFDFIVKPLSIFFSNVFDYKDYWMFNKNLINWYKPDIIIEIKTERFLEKMSYELV